MSELPAKVWRNIAETRQARIDELETVLRDLKPDSPDTLWQQAADLTNERQP